MSYFWGVVVLLTLLAFAIVWRHFFRVQKLDNGSDETVRQETNIALYKEHLAELEQDLANGTIEQESYDELKTELDRSLLADSEGEQAEKVQPVNQGAFLWAVAASLFIGVFSYMYYDRHGAHEILAKTPQAINSWELADNSRAAQAQHAHTRGSVNIVEQLKQLRAEVEKNPENSEAWYQIGQILMEVGEFQAALVAIDNVIDIEGANSGLLAQKAQTLYYVDGQQITERVQEVVDQTLAIDPHAPGVLVMLGMDAFFKNEFQKAIDYWQKLLHAGRSDVNVNALTNAINEARSKLMAKNHPSEPHDHPPGEHDHDHPASEQVTAAPVIEGPYITVNVSMTDEVISNLTDDKTVFVYAIAANGPRMPVAAVKLMASDLPIQITLSDANAMSPAANLSKTERINLVAVLSMSGQPGQRSGDFTAQIDDLANDHEQTLDLVIATQVP